MSFDDGLNQHSIPFSTFGFSQICSEYGADYNGMFKCRVIGASLTNGEW